ncbi:hypothetical protein NCC78_18705 [Micromonospora phytophila]|uniref:hypothetical protein n=1 Tax=Micromonospora phytophila TaxID=709888 RepID=UPI00202F2D76|nr:hypothetical protein [Micromonospora phytophila]MCM0676699.1 hypothetical protein [Micromonospora phytophila]
MHAAPNRRLAAAVAAVAAVALTVPAAACGTGPVSPLPVQPGSTSPTPAPTPTRSAAPTATPTTVAPTTARAVPAPPRPTRPRGTPRPALTPTALPATCQGAVRYDLPLAETELELLKSLCFATGAVLRIQGIGPGLVTVDREDLVSRNYAGGVVDIRFVRPGTVAVMIPQGGRTHTITVVVR